MTTHIYLWGLPSSTLGGGISLIAGAWLPCVGGPRMLGRCRRRKQVHDVHGRVTSQCTPARDFCTRTTKNSMEGLFRFLTLQNTQST